MCPARAFCVIRDAFWEFSYNYHLRYLDFSPVFKSARLANEEVSFEQK